ncbi:hypothetical protein PAXRUDRAFT_529390 [Paxillus rubicundulus Ve08.2h10]|uniref:Unplaced genomic scaffold scaffold_384, whole genome shotgun sequence n=1 Tax=Paxillus rubicundulus Ve08.2h10 TaxID=930991 RepID=A0A0D0D893_9AGAM|nr:hypothetical protein PAXRUDRAFT_529390 [Paxillus rubicundulus Ve08.2h10]
MYLYHTQSGSIFKHFWIPDGGREPDQVTRWQRGSAQFEVTDRNRATDAFNFDCPSWCPPGLCKQFLDFQCNPHTNVSCQWSISETAHVAD